MQGVDVPRFRRLSYSAFHAFPIVSNIGFTIKPCVSGYEVEGGWRKGKRHGKGIEIAADGQRTEGVWEDGKRVEAAAKEQQAEPTKTQTTTRRRCYDLD